MSAELISVRSHYPKTPPLEEGDTPLQSRVPLSVVATNTVWDATTKLPFSQTKSPSFISNAQRPTQ